jgi:hypothetical protein
LDVEDASEANTVMCPKRIGIIVDVQNNLVMSGSSRMDLSVLPFFPELEMVVKAMSPRVKMSMRCTVFCG